MVVLGPRLGGKSGVMRSFKMCMPLGDVYNEDCILYGVLCRLVIRDFIRQ